MSAVGLFNQQFKDYWQFLCHPDLRRRPLRGTGDGWWKDWIPGLTLWRLLQWAVFMWLVSLFLLAPVASYVMTLTSSKSLLTPELVMSWRLALMATIWAPIVEELTFRFCLRRPKFIIWMLPVSVLVLLMGPGFYGITTLVLLLLVLLILDLKRQTTLTYALAWKWRKKWCQYFPLIFHGAVFLFALMHLANFSIAKKTYWLLPLMVLPQWFAGSVIAWIRVRDGVGSAMMLHFIYNAGPTLLMLVLFGLLHAQS